MAEPADEDQTEVRPLPLVVNVEITDPCPEISVLA